MTLIKRNRIWHYQAKINGRTFHRTTGHTDRRLAQQVARKIETEVRLRKKQPGDWLRLSQAMNREVARIETDVSGRRAERVLSSFGAFLKWLGRDPDITEITQDLLESFQRHRLKVVARSTVNQDLTCLLRLLRENGIHVAKPSPKAGRETEVRAFTRDELVLVFNHVTEYWRPLYATLLVTGARPAELSPSPRSAHKPLLKTEIDFESGIIHLRQAKGRLGKRPRSRPPIPVPQDVLHLLKEQVARTPGAYPFVFTAAHNAARDFNRTLQRAGIPRVDAADRKLMLHSFRHTYATLMAGQVSNNPHFLKSLLGHSKITTTDRYCQVEACVVPISDFNLSLARKPTKGAPPATVEVISRVEGEV